MSLTSRLGAVFGGAWLPPQFVGQNTDNEAFDGSPLAIQRWVISCREQRPGIKRGDPAPCLLECPVCFNAGVTMGVYRFSRAWKDSINDIANMSVKDEIAWAVENVKLYIEVPMKMDIFNKFAMPYRINPSSIKDIDELWDIMQWQKGQPEDTVFAPFPVLRPDAVYLANLRFAGGRTTDLPLSPRMAGFVKSAETRDVRREALALACIVATGSATFNPCPLYSAAGHEQNSAAGHEKECPLLLLSHILDDIDGFVRLARQAATKLNKPFADLKIHIGKLRKAEALWWKCDLQNRARRSALDPDMQSIALADLFSDAIPEQVACLADDNWYAAGLRVRGKDLPKQSQSGRILLFCPREEKWVKHLPDQGQPHLKFLFCMELSAKTMRTMVVISDSSCGETGFRYGLTCAFRQAGIFVLWLVCKGGAKALDLCQAWSKSPRADFGVTIYNCNDVTTTWLWEVAFANDVTELVLTAKLKCSCKSFFYVNNARLYPDLRPECYPDLVRKVSDAIRLAGGIIFDGANFVGNIKLRDTMHFHIASTQQVVEMFSECVISDIQSTAAETSNYNVAASSQDVVIETSI